MSRDGILTRVRLVAPVVVASALAFGGGDAAAQGAARERFTLEGGSVAIYNLAGEVRVEPGSGPAVVVEVERGGADAASLKIETGPKAGSQTLRVVSPGGRVLYGRPGQRTTVEVAPDGTFGGNLDLGWLSGRRRVTVSGSGGGLRAWANLRVRVPKGQTLRLHHAVGECLVEGVDGDVEVDHHAGGIEARGCRGRLVLDTGSGRVVVKDVQGDVTLDTGSGAVEVEGARGSRLRMDTGSGFVRVAGAAVDELIADTGSGGMELDQVRAKVIRLDSGSGHVELGLLSGVESLVVDTGSGAVTIFVPGDLNAEFDLETGSGPIDVDVPHEAITVERGHVSGRFGQGRGRIHVDTGSGGIRIVRRAIVGVRSGTISGAGLLPHVG